MSIGEGQSGSSAGSSGGQESDQGKRAGRVETLLDDSPAFGTMIFPVALKRHTNMVQFALAVEFRVGRGKDHVAGTLTPS